MNGHLAVNLVVLERTSGRGNVNRVPATDLLFSQRTAMCMIVPVSKILVLHLNFYLGQLIVSGDLQSVNK